MTMKKYPTGAGMIVIRDFGHLGLKVLVLKNFDGTWDLPKGKLDPGESLERCAVREMMEESSITDVTYPWGNARTKLDNLTFYMCMTDQDPEIIPNPSHGYCEHEFARWVDPTDAVGLLPKFLKPAMTWAIDTLSE
jgi:8-oxo-dGTP pyrophosphatase MutT (NUDIX family)